MKNQLAESVGLGSTEKIVLIRGRALENFSIKKQARGDQRVRIKTSEWYRSVQSLRII